MVQLYTMQSTAHPLARPPARPPHTRTPPAIPPARPPARDSAIPSAPRTPIPQCQSLRRLSLGTASNTPPPQACCPRFRERWALLCDQLESARVRARVNVGVGGGGQVQQKRMHACCRGGWAGAWAGGQAGGRAGAHEAAGSSQLLAWASLLRRQCTTDVSPVLRHVLLATGMRCQRAESCALGCVTSGRVLWVKGDAPRRGHVHVHSKGA